ncbi:MAG: hypothetical protein EBS48_06680, partial [Actinobacteria bacterium]|nr:hypothetical protein [Actinomycetota bacterium]
RRRGTEGDNRRHARPRHAAQEPVAVEPREALRPLELESLVATARDIVAEGVPPNTRRTYRSQWQHFCAWCTQHKQPFLPTSAETLVMFLTDRSKEVKVSSLEVALAAITVAPSPVPRMFTTRRAIAVTCPGSAARLSRATASCSTSRGRWACPSSEMGTTSPFGAVPATSCRRCPLTWPTRVTWCRPSRSRAPTSPARA